MDLYDKVPTPGQLYRRVGRLEQVAGIELVVLDEGPARSASP